MSVYVSPTGNAEVWALKPDGYYDLAEWLEMGVPGEVIKNHEPIRQQAYKNEADDIFKHAQYYAAEAEGFRLLGNAESAAVAEEKAQMYLKEYAAKKQEIRELYPDTDVES